MVFIFFFLQFFTCTILHSICAALSVPCLLYLLQRGVRDAVAGEAEVSHGRVELSEERGESPVFGSSVGQDEGDLLTDAFQEDRPGDVASHKLTHCCQICWKKSHKMMTKQILKTSRELELNSQHSWLQRNIIFKSSFIFQTQCSHAALRYRRNFTDQTP